MAMTPASMATSIKTEIEATGQPIFNQAIIDAIATAVVENIQANAQVSGNTTGTEFAQVITVATTAVL